MVSASVQLSLTESQQQSREDTSHCFVIPFKEMKTECDFNAQLFAFPFGSRKAL